MNWFNILTRANAGILLIIIGAFALAFSIQLKLKHLNDAFKKSVSQLKILNQLDIDKLRKYLFWIGFVYIVIGLVCIGINVFV